MADVGALIITVRINPWIMRLLRLAKWVPNKAFRAWAIDQVFSHGPQYRMGKRGKWHSLSLN